MSGEKNEIKIPAKFICNQKVSVGLFKNSANQAWAPSTVKLDVTEDFFLTIDRIENFKGEDKVTCELVEKSVTDTSDKLYKIQKKLGLKLCALKHAYLHKKPYKYASLCNTLQWEGKVGVYCNDFSLNISDREYVDLPPSNFIQITGEVKMTQGSCTPTP